MEKLLRSYIIKKDHKQIFKLLQENPKLVQPGFFLLFSLYPNKEHIDFCLQINPKLFKEVNQRGETILFNILKDKKEEWAKELIKNHNIDQINKDGQNILDFALSKEVAVDCILRKLDKITPNNYYQLQKKNRTLPKKFRFKKLKDKKNHLYIPFEVLEIIDIDPQLNYTKMNLLALQKKLNLNIDHIRNIIQNNADNIWLSDIEFSLLTHLISILKNKVSPRRLYTLLDNIIKENELYNYESLILNLKEEDIPSNIKFSTLEQLSKIIQTHKLTIENEQENYSLDTHLNILNNKSIEGFNIWVPQNSQDLVDISKTLHICVGRGNHYVKKSIDFKCQIIALKKNSKIEYCIELDPKDFFQITQAEGLFGKKMEAELNVKLQYLIDSVMGRYL